MGTECGRPSAGCLRGSSRQSQRAPRDAGCLPKKPSLSLDSEPRPFRVPSRHCVGVGASEQTREGGRGGGREDFQCKCNSPLSPVTSWPGGFPLGPRVPLRVLVTWEVGAMLMSGVLTAHGTVLE